MHPLDTGLAPTPLLVAPAPVEWRLTWGEWVGLACLGAALFVACFCGSYELKTALGIDLIPGYHLQDVLPFYPR